MRRVIPLTLVSYLTSYHFWLDGWKKPATLLSFVYKNTDLAWKYFWLKKIAWKLQECKLFAMLSQCYFSPSFFILWECTPTHACSWSNKSLKKFFKKIYKALTKYVVLLWNNAILKAFRKPNLSPKEIRGDFLSFHVWYNFSYLWI